MVLEISFEQFVFDSQNIEDIIDTSIHSIDAFLINFSEEVKNETFHKWNVRWGLL